MARGIQEISITEVENQPSSFPIFALNSSAESTIGQPGQILLSIPKQNGTKSDPLRIPQTWLPVELTKQIPRAQLISSAEFRQAIENRLITLISPVDAKKLEQQEGANGERARVSATQSHLRVASAARSISDSGAEISRVDGNTDNNTEDLDAGINVAQKAAAGVENTADGLTPSFQMWADRLTMQPDTEALNSMRVKGTFNRKELRYLLANLTSHPTTQKRIKATLARKAT